MKNNDTIICIGHNENIYLFNSIGIKGYIESKEEIFKLVEEKIKEDIKIFLISDYFSDEVSQLREKYKEKAYPIFLILPMDGKLTGEGVKQISKTVERATGITLF